PWAGRPPSLAAGDCPPRSLALVWSAWSPLHPGRATAVVSRRAASARRSARWLGIFTVPPENGVERATVRPESGHQVDGRSWPVQEFPFRGECHEMVTARRGPRRRGRAAA